MKKQLILVVTKADIAKGKRGDYCACPIAQSVKRRFRAKTVIVTYDHVRFGHRCVPITGKMEAWMSAYDDGLPVKPTAFFLDAAV